MESYLEGYVIGVDLANGDIYQGLFFGGTVVGEYEALSKNMSRKEYTKHKGICAAYNSIRNAVIDGWGKHTYKKN